MFHLLTKAHSLTVLLVFCDPVLLCWAQERWTDADMDEKPRFISWTFSSNWRNRYTHRLRLQEIY